MTEGAYAHMRPDPPPTTCSAYTPPVIAPGTASRPTTTAAQLGISEQAYAHMHPNPAPTTCSAYAPSLPALGATNLPAPFNMLAAEFTPSPGHVNSSPAPPRSGSIGFNPEAGDFTPGGGAGAGLSAAGRVGGEGCGGQTESGFEGRAGFGFGRGRYGGQPGYASQTGYGGQPFFPRQATHDTGTTNFDMVPEIFPEGPGWIRPPTRAPPDAAQPTGDQSRPQRQLSRTVQYGFPAPIERGQNMPAGQMPRRGHPPGSRRQYAAAPTSASDIRTIQNTAQGDVGATQAGDPNAQNIQFGGGPGFDFGPSNGQSAETLNDNYDQQWPALTTNPPAVQRNDVWSPAQPAADGHATPRTQGQPYNFQPRGPSGNGRGQSCTEFCSGRER